MFPLGIVVKEEIETDEVEGKQIYMKLGLFITYLQFYLLKEACTTLVGVFADSFQLSR